MSTVGAPPAVPGAAAGMPKWVAPVALAVVAAVVVYCIYRANAKKAESVPTVKAE